MTGLLAMMIVLIGAPESVPHPLPAADQAPTVGIGYRISPACTVDLELGNTWWRWKPFSEWPPPRPFELFMPYEVPGVITLVDPDRAMFIADVNAAQLWLTRIKGDQVRAGGCV